MFHFNRVEICGTLTRKPEIKYTPKGTAVGQVGLAINRVFRDANDEKVEETTFVDVEVWGKTAEVIGEYCDKGHTIFIEGRLRLDQWEDKQTGENRYKLKVIGEKMHFVAKPKGEGATSEETARPMRRPASKPQGAPRPPADPDLDVGEDDIPF